MPSALVAIAVQSKVRSLPPPRCPVHAALRPHGQPGVGLTGTGAPCPTWALSLSLSFPTPQEEYQEYEPEA